MREGWNPTRPFGLLTGDLRGGAGACSQHGYREDDEKAGGEGGEQRVCGDPFAIAFAVHDGAEAMFHGFGSGHSDRADPLELGVSGDIEELLGVRGGLNSLADDVVVAGELAFLTELAGGEPGERIEEVDGAGELSEGLPEPVATFDVSGFMGDDHLESHIAPGGGFGWEEDHGME